MERQPRQRSQDIYQIRLDRVAVYPTVGVKPLVEVFPLGRRETFRVKILEHGKSKQEGNPTYKAQIIGTQEIVSLGGGTAVRPVQVFEMPRRVK